MRVVGTREALKVVGTRPAHPDGIGKVAGRANSGAGMVMSGMLRDNVKRSPHAHARILPVNCDNALKLPRVKAVTTRAGFPDISCAGRCGPADVAARDPRCDRP
ncbi:MAG: hypothetical protein ACREE4_17415 [Stellaceae bacterium]